MQACRSPNQRGFTLIEALISLVVLSLGLFGLMQIQTRVMTDTGDSKTRTAAANLALEKLEELRASSYAGIVSDDAGETVPAQPGGTTDFTRSWVVTSHTSPPYKEVSVTTSWTNADRNTESLTLTTFIARSAAVALDRIGGADEGGSDSGNGDDSGDGESSGDSDEPGGRDDSGIDDGDSAGREDDAGDSDNPDGDRDVGGPGSCSCFYGQNKKDIRLLESKGGCCSTTYCATNAPPGIKKNTSFMAICTP
jgi:type IV pilus modification protein PilV